LTANLIDGKGVARQTEEEVAGRIRELGARGIRPGLTVIRVGDDPASEIYVRSKAKKALELGLDAVERHLPATVSDDELTDEIDRLNADDSVDGILLQLPLPEHLDARRHIERIDPKKDVDGFHPVSVGNLHLGRPCLVPCTPAGVIRLVESTGVEIRGSRAVVVGRSDIVGKPVAALLLQRHATVTICHSRTRDLGSVIREGDIVIAAVGRPLMITGEMIRPGAVVVDVGINRILPDSGHVEPSVTEETREARRERSGRRGRRRLSERSRGRIVDHAGTGWSRTDDDRDADEQHGAGGRGAAGMILRVGLTGGLASGKSTAGRILAGLGCVVIDADRIVHDLYRPGEPGWEALVGHYGRDILHGDDEIDRPKLAALALSTPEGAAELNGLIHPLVLEREAEIIAAEERRFPDEDRIVVAEATLLLEAGGRERYDRIIVVDAPRELQIRRAVERGLTKEDAARRIARQMTREQRRALADYVIGNDGDLGALERSTRLVWDDLMNVLGAKPRE